MNLEIAKAQAALENAKSIVICGHASPDGDCIGAAFAMALMLREIGKRPLVLLEPYGHKYDFLPGREFLCHKEDISDVDVFMALDCGTVDRFDEFKDIFQKAKTTINIDHHVSNRNFADINIVEADISSTCELLYKIFIPYYSIDKDIAACLYAGLVYDTGGFLHSSTKPQTHRMAMELLEISIDHTSIYKELLLMKSFIEGRLIGEALSHMGEMCGGKIVYSKMSLASVIKHGGTLAELDSVIHNLNCTRGADLAVFVYERDENESKVSLRSNSSFNVAEYAQKNGGGGHIKAAGFNMAGNADDVLNAVLNDLKKLYE